MCLMIITYEGRLYFTLTRLQTELTCTMLTWLHLFVLETLSLELIYLLLFSEELGHFSFGMVLLSFWALVSFHFRFRVLLQCVPVHVSF